MAEKKVRARKYFISTQDNQHSLVVIATSEKEAARKWAARYGSSVKQAVVRPIGSHAKASGPSGEAATPTTPGK